MFVFSKENVILQLRLIFERGKLQGKLRRKYSSIILSILSIIFVLRCAVRYLIACKIFFETSINASTSHKHTFRAENPADLRENRVSSRVLNQEISTWMVEISRIRHVNATTLRLNHIPSVRLKHSTAANCVLLILPRCRFRSARLEWRGSIHRSNEQHVSKMIRWRSMLFNPLDFH